MPASGRQQQGSQQLGAAPTTATACSHCAACVRSGARGCLLMQVAAHVAGHRWWEWASRKHEHTLCADASIASSCRNQAQGPQPGQGGRDGFAPSPTISQGPSGSPAGCFAVCAALFDGGALTAVPAWRPPAPAEAHSNLISRRGGRPMWVPLPLPLVDGAAAAAAATPAPGVAAAAAAGEAGDVCHAKGDAGTLILVLSSETGRRGAPRLAPNAGRCNKCSMCPYKSRIRLPM